MPQMLSMHPYLVHFGKLDVKLRVEYLEMVAHGVYDKKLDPTRLQFV